MSVYEVVETDYGMKIEYKGFPSPEDVAAMSREIDTAAKGQSGSFGVLVDMRNNRAFSPEAADLMKSQIRSCVEQGMKRACVVLQSAIMALQAKRIVSETGIADILRFVDASSAEDWEKVAIDWIDRGVEPTA